VTTVARVHRGARSSPSKNPRPIVREVQELPATPPALLAYCITPALSQRIPLPAEFANHGNIYS